MAVILKGEYIPMRKNLAKLIALMMALVLVFSFAACGGDKDEQPSDTTNEAVVNTEDTATPGETGDTAASDGTSDTAAPGESKQDDTTNKTDTDTPAPGGIVLPNNAASGVKLYNDALAKVSSTKATVNRDLNYARVEKGIIKIDLFSLGDVRGLFKKGGGNLSGAKLSALSAGDVADFSSKQVGNSYELKFTLKTVKCDQTAKFGKGGYMYFITMDEIANIVKQIGDELSGGSIAIKVYKDKSSFNLEKGVFTVNIDKNTGKLTSATLSFTETIDGRCNAPISGPFAIDADAAVQGYGTVKYTLS